MKWPGGRRYGFTFSFHFDAETLWTSRDANNAIRTGVLSQGAFGAKFGVDQILRVLEARHLSTTFFVPGLVAETHPEVVRRIADAGHELGHHGYAHEHPDPDDPEGERIAFRQGLSALSEVGRTSPVGYCSPAWETTPQTLGLLLEEGFLYSTNFMDDIQPYLHQVPGGNHLLVELPVHWMLDDAPFRLFSPSDPRSIISAHSVGSIWREETRAIAKRGGLVNLIMHPQITGRPAMLDEFTHFLDEVLDAHEAHVARNDEIATWAVQQLVGGNSVTGTDQAIED